ncbi:MAG: sugar ABC transporter permease [Clostridia bacterium]|nr:sugar ABC transporter permease [Clostridia bacterium]
MNRKLLRRIINHWQIYCFLLLPLIYLILFHYVPMVGAQIAFRKFTIRSGIWNSKWVGFDNFVKFFKTYNCWTIIKNTVTISTYSILAGFPIPIVFALLLNCVRQKHYKKAIQTITYMPHFISTVVIVGMILQIANPRVGLYGTIFHALTGEYPQDPLGSTKVFTHLYVWSGIWQQFGWNAIVYLAALSAVDLQLHEAAIIDGASRWQRVLHVDLPCILPTATIMLIMRAGSVMSVGYEKIYLMQNNLNLGASEVISTYVYKIGLGSGGNVPNYSLSTAIGLFNSVVNLVLICVVNSISKKLSETSLW